MSVEVEVEVSVEVEVEVSVEVEVEVDKGHAWEWGGGESGALMAIVCVPDTRLPMPIPKKIRIHTTHPQCMKKPPTNARCLRADSATLEIRFWSSSPSSGSANSGALGSPPLGARVSSSCALSTVLL